MGNLRPGANASGRRSFEREMTHRKPPQDCADMSELRQAIDAIDVELVKLLRDRADYIDRAVTLKQANGWPARIQSRVEEVIANACRVAEAEGLDPQLVECIWRDMVDWSISREAREIPET
ncbi:chorismate mutase [Tritonibacter mobilis]|uniref:chorismate mutase n=2 Tax=Tritonibacter mobilis TaxID=379347 RepID=A0A1B1A432_9RHOB|nr:chorismate mutase [Tritonibacter mobilis F1926]KJZ25589.1 chorismate mutase [Tritonibacter mobilis]